MSVSGNGFVAIPRPPSANRLWRHSRSSKRPYRSREYMTWLNAVSWMLKPALGHIDGHFRVVIKIRRPDARKRDIDNAIKPCLDALQHSGVVEDDSLCQEVIARWDNSVADCEIGVFKWHGEVA